MGADFISAAIWRRGDNLAITDEEFVGIRERINALTPDELEKRMDARWSDYSEEDMLEVETDEGEPIDDPSRDQVAQQMRRELLADVEFLEAALGGGRRDVGGLTVGPYVVLLMGEMSWGDVDEGMESIWRLADSRVLEPLGFQCSGYVGSVHGIPYGTVISAIFEVIADRRECKVEDVVAAANKIGIYEDRMWEYHLGPAVDHIEDALSEHLPEYPT